MLRKADGADAHLVYDRIFDAVAPVADGNTLAALVRQP